MQARDRAQKIIAEYVDGVHYRRTGDYYEIKDYCDALKEFLENKIPADCDINITRQMLDKWHKEYKAEITDGGKLGWHYRKVPSEVQDLKSSKIEGVGWAIIKPRSLAGKEKKTSKDNSWAWDDTLQECYVAYLEKKIDYPKFEFNKEGRSKIYHAVRRAYLTDQTTKTTKKPYGKKVPKRHEWSTKKEDRLREEKIAKDRGYDVKSWLKYWKDVLYQKRIQVWNNSPPLEDREHFDYLVRYKKINSVKAAIPVVIGGKKVYWDDKDTRQTFLLIDEKYIRSKTNPPELVFGRIFYRYRDKPSKWADPEKDPCFVIDKYPSTLRPSNLPSTTGEAGLFETAAYEDFAPQFDGVRFGDYTYERNDYDGYILG